MSEPMFGRIEFGGKLKEGLIPDLLEAMSGCIWNDHTKEDMKQDIESCNTQPSVLEYSEYEAHYGQFESLEDFCIKHGLTFAAFRSGDYEGLPEVRSYNGDTEDEYRTICDTSGNPLLDKGELFDTLSILQELTDDSKKVPLNLNSKCTRTQEVAKHLAATSHNKPLILLKEILTNRHREPVKVPVLEIIS